MRRLACRGCFAGAWWDLQQMSWLLGNANEKQAFKTSVPCGPKSYLASLLQPPLPPAIPPCPIPSNLPNIYIKSSPGTRKIDAGVGFWQLALPELPRSHAHTQFADFLFLLRKVKNKTPLPKPKKTQKWSEQKKGEKRKSWQWFPKQLGLRFQSSVRV